MAKTDIDFLRFSAYSIKELITRKLSEDTKFTDQVYSGSNMSILIDVFSYMAQMMLYSLNTAASESMFSDTKFYRNMNRLVKLLGYNPSGFTPSTAEFLINFENNETIDDIVIPKYAAIDTGKSDSQGNKVLYSFVEDYTTRADDENKVTLYNGKWKLYQQQFTASGIPYETFLLTGIESDSTKDKFVANNFIDVYVQREGVDTLLKFNGITDEIFVNMSQKYDGGNDGLEIYNASDADRLYSIRLNENKVYEIKFGNGVNGQKLQNGDVLYILYLDTNGFDGELNIGEVSEAKILNPIDVMGLNKEYFYRNFLNYTSDDEITRNYNEVETLKATNISKSSLAVEEESVDEIRETAPNYYKLGNRLITQSDYEYYVKNRFKTNIIDVLCQNNWEYISTFYGWLYNIGKTGILTEYGKYDEITGKPLGLREPKPNYYINDMKFTKYGYAYSDPADVNNVYIWTRLQNENQFWKTSIKTDVNNIKVITAEVVPLDPINVCFDVCAAPIDRAIEYLTKTTKFDTNEESYIEVTVSDNSLYSNSSVNVQVNSIIVDYFKETNMKLGQKIDINEIVNRIYNIGGIERIRTVFTDKTITDTNKKYQDRYIDGICFASWSASVLDSGDDLMVSNINKTLQPFQFPVLYNKSLLNKIKVIKRSFSNSTAIQY